MSSRRCTSIPEDASHEAYAAQIELRIPPAETAADAVAAACRAAQPRRSGPAPRSWRADVHPTARFGDAELVPTERYARVADEMRGIVRRTPESALHVHVGMPDGQSAVRAFNALRRHMPLLLGLSANSPWWFGIDSGSRAPARRSSAPIRAAASRRRCGIVADAEERVAAMLVVAGCPGADVPLVGSPTSSGYGTIEVRELDVQSSLDSSAALGALVRSLAREAQDVPGRLASPSELLNWSAFRAGRDGTDATILDDGRLRPLRQVARRTVDRLRPLARESGDADALDTIARILEREGAPGANGQRMPAGASARCSGRSSTTRRTCRSLGRAPVGVASAASAVRSGCRPAAASCRAAAR